VRRLQSLGFPRGLAVLPADQPPFEGGVLCSYIMRLWFGSNSTATVGDLKVLILGSSDGRGQAALRLHESADNDEDGCLWRMRSEDEAVLGAVKQALAG
jgi:AP-4 complex subunit epsilon-1